MGVRSIRGLGSDEAGFSTAGAARCCLTAVLLTLAFGPIAVQADEASEVKPGVSEPSAPAVQQQDVKSLSEKKPVKQWKPGEPVRVMGDLRESGTTGFDKNQSSSADRPPLKPIVREAVSPQVMEGRVDELPKAKPYKEGEPVRVVPDLKESTSGD